MDEQKSPSNHTRTINPVVSFIIGLSIILLASILNAAGLNLTKLDHVRTSAIPKSARKKDWLRPLWLLGMLLYILSQLIGSTLALEYMRAEYVAPLGSSSLVFNFLFARFLVGTPVTSNDIYGTAIVVLGVCGIVAFGSINSGLATETDVKHVTFLWRRGGWLGFFFFMSIALILVLLFTYRLDAILAARGEINAVPFAAESDSVPASPVLSVGGQPGMWQRIKRVGNRIMRWISQCLENWTAAKDDKTVAWTLGIGWACCGGGLAGGTLVFAKATVKLVSGSLSHENEGNQFGHAAPIFTIILLAVTAVLQIICLNRGLKVYDSTLVVPVFYGVYTATGFLNSLIFNNEVDAYQSWTLFLIFLSILVLVCGVVLLTHKKPEQLAAKAVVNTTPRRPIKAKAKTSEENEPEDHEEAALNEGQELWAIGNESDGEDEDIDHHQNPRNRRVSDAKATERGISGLGLSSGNEHEAEGRGLMGRTSEDDDDHRPSGSVGVMENESEEFADWAEVDRAASSK